MGTPQFIGRYRVVGRIGSGAMGVVYAADDEVMGRRVAIKVMMAGLDEGREARERFSREAKITGQLVHPNIVTVFDLGEDDRCPYMVMELLDAVPLSDYLQRREASALDAKIDLMLQVCDGLQAAHDRGVVHRDVKPSNLLVGRDGTLKILDFGVAHLTTSALTASGLIVGTPEYMSPEQAKGLPVDRRSDIFSAAAVFYFMVTGRAPFGHSDVPNVLNAVLHSQPAAITDDEAPEALKQTFMRALEKDPDRRLQSCAHLRAEIEQVRLVKDGESHRMARAALQRYHQIEGLIAQRRALGRRLGVVDIDRICDEGAASLARRFPEFARHAIDDRLVVPLDLDTASAALSELQTRHNTELAAVAVLRAANGDPDGSASQSSLGDRTAALFNRPQANGQPREPQ